MTCETFTADHLPSDCQSFDVIEISESLIVRLTLDVRYSLNGDSSSYVVDRLLQMIQRAIGEGLLNSESQAEVQVYSMNAVTQPESLSEDELVSFMMQRIENGSLPLEDIPLCLARYGLMEPNAFNAEMRERIDLAKVDDMVTK
ncbi:MAG: hypothetical protein ACK4VS_06335 [Burkholderiales bacterium]|jgi:hypothetical protein|nr:hypothetical protein [Burkholderiales bacterium]